MRVVGIPLASSNQSLSDYLLDLRFDESPIVDSAARHTLSYPAGVTVSNSKGLFDGSSGSYITVNDNQSDFDWSANFHVVGTFTPTDLTGYRALWDTHEGGGYASTQRLGIFTSPNGSLNVYTAGATVAYTAAGVMQLNVATEVGFFRTGTRCYFVVNGILIFDFEMSTLLNNPSRKMYVGGSEYIASQFKGSIDAFKVLRFSA